MVACLATKKMELPVWPSWLARLVSPVNLVWFVALVCVHPVWDQVSGHQRLGVESKTPWEVDFELAARLSPVGYYDYGLPDLATSLSIGMLLDKRWSASISVPVKVSAWPGSGVPTCAIPGDLTASIGWTASHGDGRAGGSLNLTLPSGLWQGNQEVPGSVAGGSGRWTLGLSGGGSRIIDPLVLSGYLSWSIGLAREERWGSSWRPGDFSMVLSVTEAFNEHVSCTLSLSQYASLPECTWETSQAVSWGNLPYGTVGYDAAMGVDFLFSGQSLCLGIGISKGLVHGADPGSVGFSVGYNFRQREEP